MSRNISTYSLLAVALILMALCLVNLAGIANADVRCGDVIPKVIPCQGFLMRGDTSPSVACCTGAQALDKEAAASQSDRQAICGCLKAAAQTLPINLEKAAMLPALCKLSTKIPIDPKVDCSRVASRDSNTAE
ncbi:hypothetical protein HAX54_047048 [Datura stramonium]|uniref:Non-specific lipid-transfer protein n=1 Tax=Datura stramonium TaxID=4076 RepID=A0ABS8SSN6_DATST|nr:hypothetical protein [Datura stramonium]